MRETYRYAFHLMPNGTYMVFKDDHEKISFAEFSYAPNTEQLRSYYGFTTFLQYRQEDTCHLVGDFNIFQQSVVNLIMRGKADDNGGWS